MDVSNQMRRNLVLKLHLYPVSCEISRALLVVLQGFRVCPGRLKYSL